MLREYLDLPRSVHILCAGMFINRAGSFVMVFLTIYVTEQLGFEKTFAAQCMGMFGLGAIAASLIGGQLADQIGRKVVMLTAMFGGAILLLALSAAESRTAVLLTIFAYALVAETFRPACSAMMGDLTEPSQRPASFGLYYICINLGFACGPPIGGILADVSYKFLFWGDALTMAAFGLIIGCFVPESQAAVPEDTPTPDDVPVTVAVKRILSDGPFVLFCLATFLLSLVFMQSVATLPIFIKDAGYSNSEFGVFMAINGLLIFLVQLPLTHFLERFNAMSNIVVGGILIGIGFGMYYWPATSFLLVAAVLVWTVGEMMQAPFKQTVVTNLAPPELRARYLGLFSMSHSLALMVGAPIGGFILSNHGSQALWSVCFTISLAGSLTYAATYRTVSSRSELLLATQEQTQG